jgi:predicted membrane channel-forming protein YqfA (hemolysin III family)
LKDNEFIKHGYRINFDSTIKVAKSLFMLHNESVNIWSHLIGSMLVILLVLYTATYIKSHKDDLLMSLHLNVTGISEEIKAVANPVLEKLPNIYNIT